MAYNSANRSERILQNRRFTTDALALGQEAFTQVLDLGVSEIYLDTAYIPTGSSQIPYSGSSQNLRIISASVVSPGITPDLPIAKFWYRKKMKPSADGTRQAYYFTLDDPNTTSDTVGSDQLLELDQQTNFILPKYISVPADSVKTTEANPPGYRVTVYKSTSATAAGISEAAATTDQYVFDYKTGVLAWVSGFQPASNQYVYITAYQYIGRTLLSQQTSGYSGSFSGSFQGDGEGLTNLPASSIVGLNLTQIADSTVSASVSATSNPLTLVSSSVELFKVNKDSQVFAELFTGSFEGDGSNVVNIPVSSVVGLDLSKIYSGSVSASVAPDKGFQVNTNAIISGTLSVTNDIDISTGNVLYTNNIQETTVNSGISYTAGTNRHRFTGSVDIQDDLIVRTNTVLHNTGITGSLEVSQNLIVQGTASFNYLQSVTGSAKIIGDAFIILNADVPTARFAGLKVIDSGSTLATSSFIYDGELNQWVFQHEAAIDSGSSIAIFGPLNTGTLGDEQGLTEFSVPRTYTDHGHHIGDSNIFSHSTNVSINKGTTGSLSGLEILGDLEVTGSSRFTAGASGSFSGSFAGQILGTLNATGSLSGSLFGVATLDRLTVNGTSDQNGFVDINGNVFITSSSPAKSPDNETAPKYSLVTSQSAWHYSDNVGYPAGVNQWGYNLDGSYFNLFNHNTDTATIVRFIAGFLSASTPAPVPNGRRYDGINSTTNNSSTSTYPAGYVSFNHSNTTIQYLIDKGFAAVGQRLFYNIGSFTSAIQTNSSISYTFTNKATGTYTVSSSNTNSDLLFNAGVLSDNISVSSSRFWKFYDNNSFTLLHNSSSEFVTTNTVLDTTNAQGLYRFQINTAAPRVIPNTFQDSRFSGLNTAYNFTSSINFTNSSSTGYYEITTSLGVGSGSSAPYSYNFTPTDSTRRFRVFYAPLTHISSSISVAAPAGTFTTMQKLTAVSRSLSGAPYLTSATYATNITASNCFNPMYNDGTIATIGISGTGVAQTGNTSGATSGGTYNTSNVFYDASGNLKTIGMIPTASDVVRLNSAITFTAPDGTNNFTNKSTLSPSSFTLSTTAYDRLNNSAVIGTTSSLYHVAGDFGQPSASGSLAYYGKADGFDNSSATFTKGTTGTENFGGESYRRNISNDVLTYTLPGTTIWNSGSRLGTKDLQVAPAKLVDPGSTSGYWYPASYGGTTKFYIREIQYASGGGLATLTVNLGTALNAWSSTSNGWSVALLLEAQKDAGSGATLLAFEVGAAAIAGPTSQTTGNQNPFSNTVNVVYNPTSVASTAYTVTLDFSKGQAVSNGNRIFVIARLNNSAYASHTVPTSLTITGN